MFASYYGGQGIDKPYGLTACNGSIYFVGETSSTNLTLRSPIQGANGGGTDGSLAIAKEASDLALFMSAIPATVTTAGGSVTYRIEVLNGATVHMPDVTVVNNLPIGATNVLGTPSVGTCTAPAFNFTCSLGILAPGATAVITVQATIPAGTGSAVNIASVTTSSQNPFLNNNTAQVKSC